MILRVMKRQIVAIHGGTSFDTYEDYISFIKTRELTLERLAQCDDWKASLGKELGEGFEVLWPKMPNGTNARYAEWSLWFGRCALLLQDSVVLIGHSLGGIFLAKYLSEHDFPRNIKATCLVAAPFDGVSTVESLNDFALPASLQTLEAQGGQIYIVHSQDDPVVPYAEMAKYQAALPKAQPMVFEDRGHFNQDSFPELTALIRSL